MAGARKYRLRASSARSEDRTAARADSYHIFGTILSPTTTSKQTGLTFFHQNSSGVTKDFGGRCRKILPPRIFCAERRQTGRKCRFNHIFGTILSPTTTSKQTGLTFSHQNSCGVTKYFGGRCRKISPPRIFCAERKQNGCHYRFKSHIWYDFVANEDIETDSLDVLSS